ncbi:MAG: hypothetical protein WAN61_03095 [Minisyncoccia bacterium]
MKRAIFPDSKLLQPIPVPNGEHPNISGNVNNATQVSPNSENIPSASNTQNVSPATQPVSAKNGNSFLFFALGCIIILLIILVVILVYRKLRKK